MNILLQRKKVKCSVTNECINVEFKYKKYNNFNFNSFMLRELFSIDILFRIEGKWVCKWIELFEVCI